MQGAGLDRSGKEAAMRSAVTICLVPEARQGPFVFHGTDTDGGLDAGD